MAGETEPDQVAKGSADERWVVIQKKTFVNWCNEQLSAGGRYVDDIDNDFCDGVKLVALVESLQFRKIGRVYNQPSSRIQMMQNVALALQAVTEDHVKLVNIGPEDIVSGSPKLILGLLWHLIIRYQISASKSKAPPKKLMLLWFQSALEDVAPANFTTDWTNGIALNALVNYCKPGLAPDWRQLSPSNSVENCRRAMQLAKEHLNVPRVISAEDFSSRALDELSAMTYLSYFIRKDSPGYYATLNWVCRQLRNTNVSNLTTDWNDGYYLCAIVHSLGGSVPGWPNLDRSDKLANCHKALASTRNMGIEPMITAAELSDPNVDHLAIMALLSKFTHITPSVPNAEKVTFTSSLQDVKQGEETRIFITSAIKDLETDKVKVKVQGPKEHNLCSIVWNGTRGECQFSPLDIGKHTMSITYDDEDVLGSPVNFTVTHDPTKVKVTPSTDHCVIGNDFSIKVDRSRVQTGQLEVEARSTSGQRQTLTGRAEDGVMTASFSPPSTGDWEVRVLLDGQTVGSPVKVCAFDPSRATLTAPASGMSGELMVATVACHDIESNDVSAEMEDSEGHTMSSVKVTTQNDVKEFHFIPSRAGNFKVKAFMKGEHVKGSPRSVSVHDPREVTTFGEGLRKGVKGEEATFIVQGAENGEGVTASVTEAHGRQVSVQRSLLDQNSIEFRYVPPQAGYYVVTVQWRGRNVTGSPFQAKVMDKSQVFLTSDLEDLRDDRDHIVLPFDLPSVLTFDISQAGPGTFTAEVLGPQGKLPVHVNQTADIAEVNFKAVCEGDHYIHLYWSEAPLEFSPMLGYCAGQALPIDASKVQLTGQGALVARATMPAEFVVDGKRAGPGEPRVELKGVQMSLPVDITPIKYDRYRCTYTPVYPGGFLLFVYWSGILVPGCPHKITVTAKGDVSKVKVSGEGLKGGIAGHELRVFVDTKEAGPGEISATCSSIRQGARVEVKQNEGYHYTLRIMPTSADKHTLQIYYDGQHVPGSPFLLRIGDPPDPSRVRVFGPGIEDGVLHSFESIFLVETHGAGAGQLAVRVRGPRGSFKVDMHRETQNERTIKCRYSPTEAGQYVVSVRWSGDHVPGSPFTVHVVESQAELVSLLKERGVTFVTNGTSWRAEI